MRVGIAAVIKLATYVRVYVIINDAMPQMSTVTPFQFQSASIVTLKMPRFMKGPKVPSVRSPAPM